MDAAYKALAESRLEFREYGITAVESYLGAHRPRPVRYVLVGGELVDLAKHFENLKYPSLPCVDAGLSLPDGTELRFRCADNLDSPGAGFSGYGKFSHDPVSGIFRDRGGIYQSLRERRFEPLYAKGEQSFFEHAAFRGLFGQNPDSAAARDDAAPTMDPILPPFEWQKDLLSLILSSPQSGDALEFLRESGFIRRAWPELSALLDVDHAKDCHPEGGGWSHTIEALGHRKNASLTLSLAILLHDVGKPLSEESEGRKFDKHAEIGASVASAFLKRLGYPASLIRDVAFFIRWHMLPAALPRIPPSSVSDIVLDPRFADLLELYRCDEFSTFRGPDAYYAACAAYKSIIRWSRNPYRDVGGKKRDRSASKTFTRP